MTVQYRFFSLSLILTCIKSTGDKIEMAGACKLGDAVTQFPSADMPVHRGHIALCQHRRGIQV